MHRTGGKGLRRSAGPHLVEEIAAAARAALSELIVAAGLRPGALVVVGGSTSEVQGERIGTRATLSVGAALAEGLRAAASAAGVELAVQCCEHLNRALVVRRAVMESRALAEVTAKPVPGAGGALAAAHYAALGGEACLVAQIAADAGLDIGETLIGMHLRPVAVPLRLSVREIGQARVTAARTRPPLIGGARAQYPEPGADR